MIRLPAILRTTAARLSALYLLLFSASAVVLVFYVTMLSQQMIASRTQETVMEEVVALTSVYERRGLSGLVRTLALRGRQPGANLYLLTDHNGMMLAGNVEMIEPGILNSTGWSDRPFYYSRYSEANDQARVHEAVAVVTRLPNQMLLLVGQDIGERERIREVIGRALIFALGLMGIGAIFIWLIVGRRALKRIDNITAASQKILAGDLMQRLPVTGAGDEFDRLSINLNTLLERIDTLNDGLKQVSDNIAHDLKTPLTRLRNRAEAALSDSEEGDEVRETLERMISESDQLIRMFNAILMISRLEAGYSAEATRVVDLGSIVADVVELYEPVAEDVGVKLSAETISGAEIDGNRELIGQALSNIVDNAIKYSAEGEGEPAVVVSIARLGETLVLKVVDNGTGIPEDQTERVTERFVRLEKSRNQQGSGLGLSLAKAVMGFHKGRLLLEKSAGNPDGAAVSGLTVSMIFPAKSRNG